MNFPPYAMETGRIEGVSLWADGTHTEAGNFFPQIGISFESLGEMWDVPRERLHPGRQARTGRRIQDNGRNRLPRQLDREHYAERLSIRRTTVGEIEFARRLGAERDAWAFAGPYFVANDDEMAPAVRVGVRGYAYPDLLLQVAVSDDDVFNTNATFSLQWFVGRTRTDFSRPAAFPTACASLSCATTT